MKTTMSKREIAKFHKFLEQDVSLKECSKYLGVTIPALKKFSPTLVEKAKQDHLSIAKAKIAHEKEQEEAAEVLAKAAKKVKSTKATVKA